MGQITPSTHTGFKERNSAWYLAGRIERDVTVNHHIKPKEICQRAGLYHQVQSSVASSITAVNTAVK
jgi:hypothetical protein